MGLGERGSGLTVRQQEGAITPEWAGRPHAGLRVRYDPALLVARCPVLRVVTNAKVGPRSGSVEAALHRA